MASQKIALSVADGQSQAVTVSERQQFNEEEMKMLGLEPDTNHLKIEFDNENSAKLRLRLSAMPTSFTTLLHIRILNFIRYWCCSQFGFWTLLTSCLALPVYLFTVCCFDYLSPFIPPTNPYYIYRGSRVQFPCIWYWTKTWVNSRMAAVTDNVLVLKEGWYSFFCWCWNERTKTVALAKITDLRLYVSGTIHSECKDHVVWSCFCRFTLYFCSFSGNKDAAKGTLAFSALK